MASDTVLGQLTLRYSEVDSRTRQSVQNALVAAWTQFWAEGNWTAATQAAAVAQFWTLVQTEILTEMNATVAFLALVESQVLSLGVPPPSVSSQFRSELTSQGVRTTDPLEVYNRPFKTVRYELTKGTEFQQALKLGLERLLTLADTDAQLAKTNTSREIMRSRSGVKLYRRVPTGKSCDLCIVASQHYYTKKNLMPIHAHCDCIVLPLYRGMPQADAYFDRYDERLENAYLTLNEDSASENRAKRAAALINESRSNSEYGPVITWADHKFTTEAELVG
jgi:hypothetical protein